jgi:ammonia channel protein AmtB
MKAGFYLLKAGLSRPKNAANIAMKNTLDFAAACLCFLPFGIDSFVGLRASQEEQEDGLDFCEHSITA